MWKVVPVVPVSPWREDQALDYRAQVINPVQYPDRLPSFGQSRPTQFVWSELKEGDSQNLFKPLDDTALKGWFDDFNIELIKLRTQ
jgi:hypothetical protein